MNKWISFGGHITLNYLVKKPRKFWPLQQGDCPEGILNWFYLSSCTLSGAKSRNQSNPNCEHYCTDRNSNAQSWSNDTASRHSLLHLV